MTRQTILDILTKIGRKVFQDYELVGAENLTALDVEGWDSMSHLVFISEVENKFAIHFTTTEILKVRRLGDLMDIIERQVG